MTPEPARLGQRATWLRFFPRTKRPEGAAQYVAELDAALTDRTITLNEASDLARIVSSAQFSEEQVMALHQDYLLAITRVALSDGNLDSEERRDLNEVANLLNLEQADLHRALSQAFAAMEAPMRLQSGDLVLFTGSSGISREELEEVASAAGYQPTSDLGPEVKLVVAANEHSTSDTVRAAKALGIAMVNEDTFLLYARHQSAQGNN